MRAACLVAWVVTLGAAPALAAPAYVQSQCTPQTTAGATSASVQLDAPPAATNSVVLVVNLSDAASSVASVTDSAGGTWTPLGPTTFAPNNDESLRLYRSPGNPTNPLVTVTLSNGLANGKFFAVYLHEYSGVGALSAPQGMGGTSATPTAGSITISEAGAGLLTVAAYGGTISSPPAGFTSRELCVADMTADRLGLAPGTYSLSFMGNDGARTWAAVAIALLGVAPDAGMDAGAPDAGGADAGTDAGTPDAGTPDASTDAGPSDAGDGGGVEGDGGLDTADAGVERRDYAVGCGCTDGPAALQLLMLLAILGLRSPRRDFSL